MQPIENLKWSKKLLEIFKWKNDRRFTVSRVLKPESERKQLSLIKGDDYEYFFFVTNTNLIQPEIVLCYEKRNKCENYIKEAK